MTSEPTSPAKRTAAARPYAGAWHAAWLVAAAAGAVLWPPPADGAPANLALGVAAVPGALGLLAPWLGRRLDAPLLIVWAAAMSAAVILMGGLAGPLAVLVMMPAPAAVILGGGRRLAAAAALIAATATAAGLAQAGGLATPVAPQPWLAFSALAAAGLALSAAFLILQRRDRLAQAGDRRRLASFMGDQPYLVLFADAAGRLRDHFGAAPDCIDVASLDVLERGVSAFAAEPARLKAAFENARREGRASLAFAPAGAADRWIVATLAAHDDGVAIVMRDATLERAREAALEQAAADAEALNAGKSRFLANMSHELRTPLNAIIGFSDIMRSRMFGPLSDKYAEYAGLIHESGGHLLDLINDVLDMSKIEAQRYELAREEFDARDAVSASLRLTRVQADQARIHLRGVLPPQPLEVDADRRAIKQIVLNLVANALKFTPPGGQVTVTARADGPMLELIVADTGVGIAPADLERLGRPYEQAGPNAQRAMGTGLGLSLVRAFAELHGGSMALESALGEGTAVTVRMPVMLAADAEAPPPPAQAAAIGGNVVAFKPQR
ncbi:MAG TPA: HAMP domain-containing sensor histidine kinase [Caulobacteraceae bacterium]|nr:HAMP domain-containing sensor histidine kinase [Caulobacteraceae bacterium]